MTDAAMYIYVKVLPAVAALAYTIYLAYVRSSPVRLDAKLKKIAKKYKKGTPQYEMYPKVYTRQFLVAWVLITLSLVIGIAYDVYQTTHTSLDFVVIPVAILTIGLSLTGLHLWIDLFRKK